MNKLLPRRSSLWLQSAKQQRVLQGLWYSRLLRHK